MNPFLTPNYEAALSDLNCGPLTSNAARELIRPVDQLAEAVRSLHKTNCLYKDWLDAIACAVYPHKVEGFTYAGPFIVAEIEKMHAAPPTAAVDAVEGMRRALEAQVCGLCCNRIGWSGDLTQAQRFLGRGDWRICVRCRDARAALAAYEEATRG
jgi:hypothetical protein